MSRIFAGKMPRDGFEATFIHRSGRTIYAWVVEAPLRDAKGEQTGWMSSILDITDRKQADALIRSQEEKLQTTARLALIGEMASNVAHELNQPLATMVSFAESGLNLSQKPSAQVSDLQPLLTRIRDQALRAAKVIKSVQALVRERQPKREAIVMQEVLNSLLPTLDAMAKQDHVVLHTELQPADLTLVADKIMLEQALINLVKNAIESFTERFTHRLVQVQVTVHEALCDIAVSDNGPGMSDEDMTRLLQPFFSTKAQGLGLGVNLCRSVCEAHGGRLIVQRGAQGGMCFLMQIPIGEAHVA